MIMRGIRIRVRVRVRVRIRSLLGSSERLTSELAL